MSGKLVNASILFITGNDDKDHDTKVTVTVTNYYQQTVAKVSGYYGQFKDTSKHRIDLQVLNADIFENLDKGFIEIHIDPNGHDTWHFDYLLTLYFDGGSSYSTDNYEVSLNQDSRTHKQGLTGRLHQIRPPDQSQIPLLSSAQITFDTLNDNKESLIRRLIFFNSTEI